jgi:hypothetical protein
MASVACGDDDALVRPRLDGGVDAQAASDAGSDAALACGAELPATYESAGFATNAAVEIALAQRFEEIEAKMKATEGASDAGATSAELKAIYNSGAPSLRALSTTPAQATVDGYFDAFEAAIGKTWAPEDAEQDGGAASGGKYGNYHFSATGVDLREAAQKTLLGGALFNRVLGLIASPVTEATADSLLAAFGASPTVIDGRDPEAGADANKLIAEYASRRDDKASAAPGPYRKIRTALLTMKAAIVAGPRCNADRDAAIATFLSEWERTTYATAIFYLNSAALAAADPQKKPQALHSFGEALGFIQSFKGLPTEKRKILDSQIDALLTKIGADSPYKLVTAAGDRALKLNEAINDIALYEGFTPAEVEAFRKNF